MVLPYHPAVLPNQTAELLCSWVIMLQVECLDVEESSILRLAACHLSASAAQAAMSQVQLTKDHCRWNQGCLNLYVRWLSGPCFDIANSWLLRTLKVCSRLSTACALPGACVPADDQLGGQISESIRAGRRPPSMRRVGEQRPAEDCAPPHTSRPPAEVVLFHGAVSALHEMAVVRAVAP